ncbi:anhydro-N-acetylmuramic acid kinase [Pararhodobacter zhoushanensis]|uniref:anhydro-N-acetylmuramic acid kinase n=1 Tax=Pararhodobacter zhoushanensis TaxID=2479545 RepID=UPI000F8CC4DE|nr:anhydro-N-acetylmuramic acid kinase [Pararhodobacter zhoushanensis]
MLKAGVQRVLGTMSGTSLDGVDAAVLLTDGVEIAGFGESAYRAYTAPERAVLRAALGCWPGDPRVEAAAEVVETAHAELLAGFEAVDMVGFHGQTLAHEPGGRGTHQAGSGQVLAQVLGWPVVWDFRSSDVRLGGQGAPLAPFYHHALARYLGLRAPVVFLNIGGVANVTWVDPTVVAPEQGCVAFDCGPGNAPMDDYCAQHLGVARDEDGALAAQGTPQGALLDRFAEHGFFRRIPPKSLDRAAPVPDVSGLSAQDALATLAAACATGVALAFEHFPKAPEKVLVCGGGRHNATLMAMIAAGCDCPVMAIEAVNLDGDMIEAQAFAFLAARVARGLPTSGPMTTGVAAPVGGGILSKP